MVFRAGGRCRGLFIVVEGEVQLYRSTADGREQVLNVVTGTGVLGDIAVYGGGPYVASARARTSTRVLFLPRSEVLAVSRETGAVDKVLGDLGEKMRHMVWLIDALSLRSVPARVASALLEFARQADVACDGGEFTLPRTQEQLAAELGTTRESVARALSRFRRAGLIDRTGRHVRLRSVEGLRHHARDLALEGSPGPR